MAIIATPSELKVFELGKKGFSKAQTAIELNVTVVTVSKHRAALISKNGVKTIEELIEREKND